MTHIHAVFFTLAGTLTLGLLHEIAPTVTGSDTFAAKPHVLRSLSEGVEQAVLGRINTVRKARGLQALKPNQTLAATATTFAGFMARTGKYGHDVDGRTPAVRAGERGYHYCLVAENLGRLATNEALDPDGVALRLVDAWLDSPGHRANILEPLATETGVAVKIANDGMFFAVQMFGRPQTARFTVKIANETAATIAYDLSGKSYSLPADATRSHERCEPGVLSVGAASSKDIAIAGADTFVVRRSAQGLTLMRNR